MHNAAKKSPMFTLEEKLSMARRAVEGYKNVRVDSYDGLLTEYVRRFEKPVVVKGLRAASDFDYEFQMNMINKCLNPAVETMFLTASERYTFLSSSIVREVAQYGAELKGTRAGRDHPRYRRKSQTMEVVLAWPTITTL